MIAARWKRLVVPVALLTTVAAGARAQSAPPGTDIYLVPITVAGKRVSPGEPRNVTHRRGYDNEPAFTASDSAILYASIGADGQADVYRYEIASGRTTRLTDTPESEYSPEPIPGGHRFSVVRVERDSAQRLWSFAMDGSSPELVLATIAPVGYDAWLDSGTLAVYVLGKPNTLELVDRSTGRVDVLARDVGRSLQRIPGRRAISYLQHEADSTWSLRFVDLERSLAGMRVIVKLATMPPRSEYVAWLPNGTVLTAQDSKLFALQRRRWKEVADLGRYGVRGITRLAVSGDGRWLAVVAKDE